MNLENLIVIKDGTYSEIKQALRQWIGLYSNDLPEEMKFKLFQGRNGVHVIQTGQYLDNERFYYLVNYLKYPEGIDYDIEIEGYTTGKDNNWLGGKDLMVYISPTDNEYDNVFVTTSDNESFKVDFGGRITDLNEGRSYAVPFKLDLEEPEIFGISPKIVPKRADVGHSEINRRFMIISLTILALLATNMLVNQFYSEGFAQFSFFIGMGIGIWFFMDYKILQSNSSFVKCFGLALAYLSLIIFLRWGIDRDISIFGALCPISILIVQKPVRLVFKKMLKREPVVDKPAPTFWDGIYMVILFVGLLAFPLVYMKFS